MLNHTDCASPKSPAGPVFCIPVEARKEESHCTALASGPFPLHEHMSKTRGSNKEDFKELSHLQCLASAEREK